MARDFFKSFFEKNFTKTPKPVQDSFKVKFPQAYNVEWHKHEAYYEAIFYINEIEIISKFEPDGTWIETGTNRDVSEIPNKIRQVSEIYGEIMNSIEFERSDSKKFEIIVRDTQLNRFLLIVDENGEVLKNKPMVDC